MESILKPIAWPTVKSSRFASRIVGLTAATLNELDDQLRRIDFDSVESVSADISSCRGIALIGLADDEGVRLNGGRPGAAEGPASFRHAMARYGSADTLVLQSAIPVIDVGDVIPAQSIAETHSRIQSLVERITDAGFFPVGIGGGHDLTLPFVMGVAAKHRDGLHGLYFDAHLDVRDAVGSGMPFRRLIESGIAKSLRCIGYDRFSNTQEHTAWFLNHGGSLEWFDACEWPDTEPQFVSVDLDVIDASQAPGVSASNPNGMSASDLSDFVYAAGRSLHVKCIDFMELSPKHDIEGMTARLLAHLFLCFFQGFTERFEEMRETSNEEEG